MTIAERRARDRAEQRRLITTTARSIAEREGWEAVTTRRLSTEIEYSQPVIYKHFASLDDIAAAVAEDGFEELSAALGDARAAASPDGALRAVAHRYASFAADAPAVYDAMFSRPTRLQFGPGSVPALSTAFSELRAAIGSGTDGDDAELLTETLWAGLHGLVALQRAGRLRPEHHESRIDLYVDSLLARRSRR